MHSGIRVSLVAVAIGYCAARRSDRPLNTRPVGIGVSGEPTRSRSSTDSGAEAPSTRPPISRPPACGTSRQRQLLPSQRWWWSARTQVSTLWHLVRHHTLSLYH
jgi:hypothetical protein